MFIRRYPFTMSVVFGVTIIVVWTVYRFISDISIFDLVGQQLYARELISSGVGDAQLGATHYLLKVFLIYIPFEWLHMAPRTGLMVMTILINSVSYILIALALRKIAVELHIKIGKFFYLGIMWLAAFAGSIFWIEFANSRNLEVAAGLWLVALGLRYIRQPQTPVIISIFVVAVLCFFMDPLQVYMTAVPLTLYYIYRISSRPRMLRRLVFFIGTIAAAYLISQGLSYICEQLLKVIFVDVGASSVTITDVLRHVGLAIRGSVIANIRLLGGVVDDGGRGRQVVALLGIVIITGVWVRQAVKQRIPRGVIVYVTLFAIVIESVYIASGQSLSGDTSRYLIMLAPLFVIMIASLSGSTLLKNIVTGTLVMIITVNSLVVVGLVIHAWPSRFSRDEPMAVAANSASDSNTRFYSGMDIALPADYYYKNASILPLFCADHHLQQAKSFFPKTSFMRIENKSVISDAVIVINGVVTNYPDVCTFDDIVTQFSQPTSTVIHGQQTILYFSPGTIRSKL
jgi:hypothetical protein